MATLAFHFGVTNRQRLQFHFPAPSIRAHQRNPRFVWTPPPVWSGVGTLRNPRFSLPGTPPVSGARIRGLRLRWKPAPFVGEIPPANVRAHQTRSRHDSIDATTAIESMPWGAASLCDRTAAIVTAAATTSQSDPRVPASNALEVGEDSGLVWRDAQPMDHGGTRASFESASLATHRTSDGWRDSAPLTEARWMPFDRSPLLVQKRDLRFASASTTGNAWRHSARNAIILPKIAGDRIPWSGSRILAGLSWPWIPLPPIPPVVQRTPLRFHFHPPIAPRLTFHFGRELAWVIPIQRSYLVNHTFSLVRLPDRTEIPVSSVTLKSAWDDWSWDFSCTLLGPDAVDLLRPVVAQPVTVELTLNGTVWQCRLDQVAGTAEFGQTGGQTRGRSLAALLGPGVALAVNGYEDEAKTARQLAEQELIGTDWQLDWPLDFPDWLVPARTFAYTQKTPIEVIQSIVETAGGRLVADPTLAWLRVAPKYPIPVWDWSETEPDVVLPRSILKTLAWQPRAGSPWDAVYLGDGATVLAKVVRAGLPGITTPDAPIIEPLLCHLDACRARGRALLSDAVAGVDFTLALPLSASGGISPLRTVGELVRFVDGGKTWAGLITAVSITIGLGTVAQTLDVRAVEVEG